MDLCARYHYSNWLLVVAVTVTMTMMRTLARLLSLTGQVRIYSERVEMITI